MISISKEFLEILFKEIQNLSNTPNLQALLVWANEVTKRTRGDSDPTVKRSVAIIIALDLYISLYTGTVPKEYYTFLPIYDPLIPYSNCVVQAKRLISVVQHTFDMTFLKQSEPVATLPLDSSYIDQVLTLIHTLYEFKIFDFADFNTLVNVLGNQINESISRNISEQESQACAYRIIPILFHAFNLNSQIVDSIDAVALRDYLYANEIMVKCQQVMVEVSNIMFPKSEPTLLLPIAEIEKRKRETAE